MCQVLQEGIYVDVEDKSEVVAIDCKQQKVTAHWPLDPGKDPTGLAIDLKNRRLFAGCANNKMVIMDGDTGKVLGNVPIGAGVDGVAFDARLGVAMSSNGRDGTLTVVREGPAGKFTVVQTLKTVKGARTIAEDAKTHQVYLPCLLPSDEGKANFGLLVVGTP